MVLQACFHVDSVNLMLNMNFVPPPLPFMVDMLEPQTLL